MRQLATAFALFAMGTAEHSPARPAQIDETRGSLKASLTVHPASSSNRELLLQITLRNTSSKRQSFFLESPGASFVVMSASGRIVFASDPCLRPWTCVAALAQLTTLEPGAQLEFVEHWTMSGKCVQPGWYTVTARLRAYQDKRPEGGVDAGSFESFLLRGRVWISEIHDTGHCPTVSRAR